MLMNKFLYRWDGLISHNVEFLTLKRIFNFYLLVFNPMRFIPPHPNLSRLLECLHRSLLNFIHFPSAVIQKMSKESEILHSAHKCNQIKASLPSFDIVSNSIFVTMAKTGNAYLREEDLCSDEEGVDELVEAMSGLSCRRSGMPPVVHAYATSHVVIQSMQCQCSLGRETLANIRPRPELDAPPASQPSSTPKKGSKGSSTKTPADSAIKSSTSKEAPKPRDVSDQPTSPADAPPPTETPRDVAGAAADAEEVVQPVSKAKKRNRRRKKKKL